MRDVTDILKTHNEQGTTWIFGDQPTILDAHTTVLAARMMDLGRFDLVSDSARIYATTVMETEQWKKATHGRPTLWNVSLGPAADLEPL